VVEVANRHDQRGLCVDEGGTRVVFMPACMFCMGMTNETYSGA
jgi:hypothetical protein